MSVSLFCEANDKLVFLHISKELILLNKISHLSIFIVSTDKPLWLDISGYNFSTPQKSPIVKSPILFGFASLQL